VPVFRSGRGCVKLPAPPQAPTRVGDRDGRAAVADARRLPRIDLITGVHCMSQPTYVSALDLPQAADLSQEMRDYLAFYQDRFGFTPNVFKAYASDDRKMRAFVDLYHALMLEASNLSELEREMIAVAVSSVNRCYYCLVTHGARVRELSGDPMLGELLLINYRVADLSARHRAMLDFATKVTESPHRVEEEDRAALRAAGFSDRDIFDISNVIGFFNMTNRVVSATDMIPNPEYHAMAR
jgi:uncharacterized peroxidase-related enzyme